MKIHIVVVADKRREAQARTLADTVQADTIAWDEGKFGATNNHRQAWGWHAQHPADWSIVLEDDAVPCKDFRAQATKALTVAPTHLVSFYMGRLRPPAWQEAYEYALERADEAKAHWLIGRKVLHAVGIAADRGAVNAVVQALTNTIAHPDAALNIWATKNSAEIAYSVPSLVDHADGDNLIVHHEQETYRPGRVAWRHGTRRKWTDVSVPLVAPIPLKTAVNQVTGPGNRTRPGNTTLGISERQLAAPSPG